MTLAILGNVSRFRKVIVGESYERCVNSLITKLLAESSGVLVNFASQPHHASFEI
jgi:hypothetical protein